MEQCKWKERKKKLKILELPHSLAWYSFQEASGSSDVVNAFHIVACANGNFQKVLKGCACASAQSISLHLHAHINPMNYKARNHILPAEEWSHFSFGISLMQRCKSIWLACFVQWKMKNSGSNNVKHIEIANMFMNYATVSRTVSDTSQIRNAVIKNCCLVPVLTLSHCSITFVMSNSIANESTDETVTHSTHHWQFFLWIIFHSGK